MLHISAIGVKKEEEKRKDPRFLPRGKEEVAPIHTHNWKSAHEYCRGSLERCFPIDLMGVPH